MMKRIALVGIALALIMAVGLGGVWFWDQLSSPAAAQSAEYSPAENITVVGQGSVRMSPDIAQVSIGMETSAETVGEAVTENEAQMEGILAALTAAGIDEKDIQTTNLELHAVQDWDTNPPKIVGWQSSNMVNVTVRDIDSVGEVVDAATSAGANSIDGISFRVEDPSEAQAVARSAAVADAEAKAQQLAADANVNIIGVITITESGGQAAPLYMTRGDMAYAAAEAAPTTPVLPGEVEVSVNVFIQYEIA